MLDYIKTTLTRTPVVGPPLYGTLHGVKKGLKDVLQPQVLFEDLGLKYLGPIDGHDEQAVEHALRRARDFGGPVLVHVITRKGFGYPPAEDNEEDRLHQVPAAAPARSTAPGVAKRTWSEVFGDELVGIGARARRTWSRSPPPCCTRPGWPSSPRAFPDRVFDVGIAEQHAVTSAAGLAMGGLHPVVAIYATFLNRAFDQVLMDVALHRLPVTFVLDRAGRHRPGRGQPQRHVGRLDPAGGARSADRRAAGRDPDRRAAGRGGRGQRRADRGPVPQGQRGQRGRGDRPDRRHGRAGPAGWRRRPGRAAGRRRADGRDGPGHRRAGWPTRASG